MELRFRVGIRTDAGAVARLGRDAFRDAFGPHNSAENMEAYLDQAFTEGQVARELADENGWFLLADHPDGELLGFAKLIASEPPACVKGDGPRAELERIYIRKGRTGEGIGGPLLTESLRDAGHRGFKTLWLGVWEHNGAAIRFYERHGFSNVGEKSFNLGTEVQTDIIMERSCL